MSNSGDYDAKNAMKLHTSTQAAATAQAGGQWTKEQKIGYAIWAVIALIVLGAVFGENKTTPIKPATPTATPQQPAVSTELLNKIALVINMNGELCAQVESVKPLGGDRYSVRCTRYRDGTGMATYELNATTGQVK